ncbi:hypothetical protein [Rubrivirga sp.]|uniref:hypothetical protein n=1 Tax=Rubrivirga sp. TaxID=1885344 RepID=UPI003C734B1E
MPNPAATPSTTRAPLLAPDASAPPWWYRRRVVFVPVRPGVLEVDLPTDGLTAGVYVVQVTAHRDGG